MTGESPSSVAGAPVAWHEPSVVQPGGREPAPGELALAQAFINSHYDLEVEHGVDLFATPAGLASWLTRRGLLPRRATVALSRRDARRAVAAREGLRELAAMNGTRASSGGQPAIAALNRAAHGAAIEIQFTDGGLRFVPAAHTGLDGALAPVLAITARAMIDGSWSRLKVCPGEHCGWAFYDHSRNLSGRWCSMAVCGGRVKARTHYRQRAGGSD